MTTPVWIWQMWMPLALNLAVFALLCVRCSHRSILIYQGFSVYASVVLISMAMWTPQPVGSYQAIHLAIDIFCAVCKVAIIIDLLRSRHVYREAIAMLVAVYLLVQTQWQLSSVNFTLPSGQMYYLDPLRKACCAALLVCFCAMPYVGNGDSSPEEANARARNRAEAR